jgi:hypothetical protein
MLLLVVSLGVWASGEVVAVRLIADFDTSPSSVFQAVVGGLWTCVGLLALYALAWNFLGREVIASDGRLLTISRCLAGWCRTQSYPISGIERPRIDSEEGGWLGAYWWMYGIKARMIAFDHDSATVRFGDRLHEAKAAEIVDELESVVAQHRV